MAQIQVTVAQLNDVENQLRKLNQRLKNEIEETDQIVAQLKNEWEGDASDAFQASYKSDSRKLLQAAEGIDSYIASLDRIGNKYHVTEARNTQIARSMK